MPNYAKNVKEITEALRKNAKNLADNKANPKSLYKHFNPEQQQAVVDSALQQMQLHHKDLNNLNEKDFIRYMISESRKEGNASKIIKEYEANKPIIEPDLHKRNFELEKQADDFLRENDPTFFEELEQAMHNYDANTTNMPRDEMVEQLSSQLDSYYDNDMSEAFKNTISTQSKKDFIKNLYADELEDLTEYYPDNAEQINKLIEKYHKDLSIGDPTTEPHKTFIRKDIYGDPFDKDNYDIIYNKPTRLSALEEQIKYNELHKNQQINPYKVDDVEFELSKDPVSNQIIDFPETSLNKRYHNVKIPKGSYFYYGQHKPGDYYHNILWNYINKGEKRDAMLDEFFQDILHKPTPTNPVEKYETIKRYKDALDERRYNLDMKNKPYNRDKLTNMQMIEEYFENQRPYSFEDFESSYLSPGKNSEHNFNEALRYYNNDINTRQKSLTIQEKQQLDDYINNQFDKLFLIKE